MTSDKVIIFISFFAVACGPGFLLYLLRRMPRQSLTVALDFHYHSKQPLLIAKQHHHSGYIALIASALAKHH